MEEELNDQPISLNSPRNVGIDHQLAGQINNEVVVPKQSFKKGLLQPNSESSSSTPESLVKLAQASLQFGELLGVRVTGNMQAAISRITTPLKKLRKKSKQARKTAKD